MANKLPQDVVGVIASFDAEHPREALRLMLVNHTWHSSVVNEAPLWLRFMRAIWPLTPQRSGSYDVLLRRIAAARELAPLASRGLHPIEDCSISFRCPMFAENLIAVGSDSASPILHCNVCNENVITIHSQEELAACGGRCVQFGMDVLALDCATKKHIVVYLVHDDETSSDSWSASKALMAAARKRSMKTTLTVHGFQCARERTTSYSFARMNVRDAKNANEGRAPPIVIDCRVTATSATLLFPPPTVTLTFAQHDLASAAAIFDVELFPRFEERRMMRGRVAVRPVAMAPAPTITRVPPHTRPGNQ